MKIFSVYEAKTQLSRLLAMVEEGEDVIIARNQHPVVRLVRFEPEREKRKFGQDKDKFQVPVDFNDPLPDEWLEAWYQ